MKLKNGKQSIEVITEKASLNYGGWMFCENGYQSTGVRITVEQFDILKELVTTPEIVEFYENMRGANNEN